jgi:hypothetical protein
MSAEDLHVPDAEQLEPDDTSGEDTFDEDAALSERLEEVERMSAVDYAKKYGGYLAAAAVVGAAAWTLYRRGKGSLPMPEGDEVIISERDPRHLKGIVSLVQRTKKRGRDMSALAISVPIDPETGNAVQEGADKVAFFAIHQTGGKDVEFSHPLRGDEQHAKRYGEGVRTAAGWVARAIRSSKKSEE